MKAITAALAAGAACLAVPATAQDASADRVTLNILRECARIADVMARVTCYDRNVGVEVAQPSAPQAPTGFGANQLPQPPAPRALPAETPGGFGANQLPQPESERSRRLDTLSAKVAAAVERTPGIWLITLEDGAQWQFVDAAPRSFDPPRKGSTIEFSAASMGSYLMQFRGQPGLRIRRVR